MTLRVRQSFAALYDSCPHAAMLSKDEGGFDTHAQARGTVMHTFAQRVLEECVANREAMYPPEMAKSLMGDLIMNSGLPIPATEYDTLMALAWKFCNNRQFDHEHIVDLEETYTTEIAGVTFTGKPDVVELHDRVATIRDWKTGWAIDPETELRGSFQGQCYAKQIFDAYPQVHTVRLVWEYQRWEAVREAVVERQALLDIEPMLASLVQRIKRSFDTDEWPASPGKWCALCPAPSSCPIPSRYRGEGEVTSPEMAVGAAEALVAFEAIRKRAKQSLRAWCKEHGPIEVGGLVWDFRQGADYDRLEHRDELRANMERVGLQWDEYFKRVNGSTEFSTRKATA